MSETVFSIGLKVLGGYRFDVEVRVKEGVESPQDVLNLLAGQHLLPLLPEAEMVEGHKVVSRDFNQINGHEFAKRALEISASGEHFVLMDGPPGCGKSLLAETFPESVNDAQDRKVRRTR
jgi:predicted ATPase with chaperone activity